MTIIAPSLLSANFLNLEEDVKRFDGIKDVWLHLDVMDGHFVPNLTFGQTVLKDLSKITEHKLDAHLMVTNPKDYIQPFRAIGVHNFTYHCEATTHHDDMIVEIKNNFPSAGISLKPTTAVEFIPESVLKNIDLILVMTVNPGFGGQSFLEGCADKVKQLNKLRLDNKYTYQIQVDGGINDKNAKELISIGADNLVAGSYIFGEPTKDYNSRIEALR